MFYRAIFLSCCLVAASNHATKIDINLEELQRDALLFRGESRAIPKKKSSDKKETKTFLAKLVAASARMVEKTGQNLLYRKDLGIADGMGHDSLSLCTSAAYWVGRGRGHAEQTGEALANPEAEHPLYPLVEYAGDLVGEKPSKAVIKNTISSFLFLQSLGGHLFGYGDRFTNMLEGMERMQSGMGYETSLFSGLAGKTETVALSHLFPASLAFKLRSNEVFGALPRPLNRSDFSYLHNDTWKNGVISSVKYLKRSANSSLLRNTFGVLEPGAVEKLRLVTGGIIDPECIEKIANIGITASFVAQMNKDPEEHWFKKNVADFSYGDKKIIGLDEMGYAQKHSSVELAVGTVAARYAVEKSSAYLLEKLLIEGGFHLRKMTSAGFRQVQKLLIACNLVSKQGAENFQHSAIKTRSDFHSVISMLSARQLLAAMPGLPEKYKKQMLANMRYMAAEATGDGMLVVPGTSKHFFDRQFARYLSQSLLDYGGVLKNPDHKLAGSKDFCVGFGFRFLLWYLTTSVISDDADRFAAESSDELKRA